MIEWNDNSLRLLSATGLLPLLRMPLSWFIGTHVKLLLGISTCCSFMHICRAIHHRDYKVTLLLLLHFYWLSIRDTFMAHSVVSRGTLKIQVIIPRTPFLDRPTNERGRVLISRSWTRFVAKERIERVTLVLCFTCSSSSPLFPVDDTLLKVH